MAIFYQLEFPVSPPSPSALGLFGNDELMRPIGLSSRDVVTALLETDQANEWRFRHSNRWKPFIRSSNAIPSSYDELPTSGTSLNLFAAQCLYVMSADGIFRWY